MSISGDLPSPSGTETGAVVQATPDATHASQLAHATSLKELAGNEPSAPEPLFDYNAIASHFGVPVEQARGMIEGMITVANKVVLDAASTDVRRRLDIAPFEGLKATLLATKLVEASITGARVAVDPFGGGRSPAQAREHLMTVDSVVGDPDALPLVKNRSAAVVSSTRARDFKGAIGSIYLASVDAVKSVGESTYIRGWTETMGSRFGPAYKAQFGEELVEVHRNDPTVPRYSGPPREVREASVGQQPSVPAQK